MMSVVPFFVIYVLSDIVAFLLCHVVRYRRKVLYDNLSRSFPEMDQRTLRKVARRAYVNVSDLLLEGLKGLSMSRRSLHERYKVLNNEVVNNLIAEGKSVILAGSHYNNWEWGVISLCTWFDAPMIGIYKPVSNRYIESYLNKLRSRLGLILYSTKETRRSFEDYLDKQAVYIMLGDQNPPNSKSAHWVDFLHRKTAWLHGIDTLSRTYNYAVVYYAVRRIKRGYYEIDISTVEKNPGTLFPQQITEQLVDKLKRSIDEDPANWLWTHKRWKHTYNDGNRDKGI